MASAKELTDFVLLHALAESNGKLHVSLLLKGVIDRTEFEYLRNSFFKHFNALAESGAVSPENLAEHVARTERAERWWKVPGE